MKSLVIPEETEKNDKETEIKHERKQRRKKFQRRNKAVREGETKISMSFVRKCFVSQKKQDKISFSSKLLTKLMRDAGNSNDGNLFVQKLFLKDFICRRQQLRQLN